MPEGRLRFGSWRLTCVHMFRQEVAGGWSSSGRTGGRQGEGGGRELEADLCMFRQEVAGGRSSGGGTVGRRGEGGGRELEAELDLHHQAIEEMRAVLQFQVGEVSKSNFLKLLFH